MDEANVALFRRYIDAMNARDDDALAATLTPGHIWHGIGNDSHGSEAFKEVLRTYVGALPDVRMEIEHIFAGDGFVGARLHHRGTHLGDFRNGTKATGRSVDFPLHVHARVEDGKLAEVWEQWNLVRLRQQIGMT